MISSRASLVNSKFYDNRRINTTSLVIDRLYGLSHQIVQRRLQSSPAYIDALEQETLLQGHEGCVNCLEWSSDGRILASGSDDLQVILWDPFRKKRLHSTQTKHAGNMFSVKFLPRHNDNLIATGAADKFIYVYDVNRDNEYLMGCNCHNGRVKRLATSPDSPFVFWSAGEDGLILQLDIRESHRCRENGKRVQLLNLGMYIAEAEAKCLAINPRRSELLAVGANDPYARIYDRRMLPLTSTDISLAHGARLNGDSTERSIPKDCVTYYCPGHINKNNSKVVEHESRAITYLAFNAAGTELLVNTGGEHIYLYDLQTAEQPVFLSLPEYKPMQTMGSSCVETNTSNNSSCSSDSSAPNCSIDTQPSCSSFAAAAAAAATAAVGGHNRRNVPEHIEAYKKVGNDFLENEKYLRAINQYSEAIALAPECPVLYLNRATAYMRRMWFGDVYAALRDCHEALRLDPSYTKAHFRLARALLELDRPSDADECLKELINRFPNYANNHGVLMLHKDIKENRQAANARQATESYNNIELSDNEFLWRSKSKDYSKRFVGHCNTTTDIKEANFFGHDGDFIVAGSDDGNFFLWERKSGNVRSIYKADGAIVNCVQPHPFTCLMATSGIDNDIKIWAPIAPLAQNRPNLVTYGDKCIEENQQKVRTDPFDLNTRNAFCWNG